MRGKKRIPTVALVVSLLGAGVLLSLLAGCSLPYMSRTVTGAVFPVPAQDGVDLLITSWDVNQEPRVIYVTYVTQEGGSRSVLWEKALQEYEGWHFPQAVSDESRVYYVAGARLLALERADGATAWEVPLSDLISNSCRRCFQKVGGYLVVLTTDYVLQGVDIGSGELAWSIRLNDAATAREGFAVVDGRIVLVDRVAPDDSQQAVHIFNPAGGTLVRQISPTCPEGDARWFSDEVFIDTSAGGRAVFLYDCLADSYAQSWSLASGEMAWQQILPQEVDVSPDSFAFGPGTLYLASYHGLFKIDLASGQATPLGEPDPDYELTLLEEHEGVVLAKARRTRGSTRHELWGLNPSGEIIWRYEVQADTLLNVDSGSGDCAYQFTSGGLVLIEVLEERMLAVALQPQTGQVIRQSEAAIEVDSLQGAAWEEDHAYVTVWGDVYAVDLETLDIRHEWP